MANFQLETFIAAPPARCFGLVRDPQVHMEAAVTHDGEFGIGQRVRFESRTFGIRQVLVVEVVDFAAPQLVTDEMISGPFRRFRHRHEFLPHPGGTLMRDTVEWVSPLGPLGRAADLLFLYRKLTRLVSARNERLRTLAESSG